MRLKILEHRSIILLDPSLVIENGRLFPPALLPGKRGLASNERDPHEYLKNMGARQVGKFGQGGFDGLYVFD